MEEALSFADDLGPLKVIQVQVPAVGLKAVLVVELSAGQMIEDVQLALKGARPIHFHCRVGGMLVSPDEVVEKVRAIAAGTSEEVIHA